jgi:hypothetical protein
MKQLNNKDMQKLKGQLNDMDYQLLEDPNLLTSTDDDNTLVNNNDTICKSWAVK